MPQSKQRVAILGGGLGSLTTAYELTKTPSLRDRYDVTVYQLGWRLGGKGASGRSRTEKRIEEHGLHIWFGFYDNAFALMRDCYEELDRRWQDAFMPCNDVVLYEGHADRWKGWDFAMPCNGLTPGMPDPLPPFWEIAHRALDMMVQHWERMRTGHVLLRGLPREPPPPAAPNPRSRSLDTRVQDLLLGHPERRLRQALELTAYRAGQAPRHPLDSYHRQRLQSHLSGFRHWLWEQYVFPNLDDDDLRLFFSMLDLLSTILVGVLDDEIIERGFGAVDDEELRGWLRRHGAQEMTVRENPVVHGAYTVAFAYLGGDPSRPALAAGAAVRGLLRLMFTYRGSFMWKMHAGMGDTVAAPLFRVLKDRDVHFKFFHRVTQLGLSADRRLIDTIEVLPQVALVDPTSDYQPLVVVRDLDCWPDEPIWKQIADGASLRASGLDLEAGEAVPGAQTTLLRRGTHFDLVVLGISVGALGPICAELVQNEDDRRFGDLLAHSPTVMTQAFQLWMNRSTSDLGWPFADNFAMTAFADPIHTYANMSHLLDNEEWPLDLGVRSIAYFCGPLADEVDDTQRRATLRARREAIAFLSGAVTSLWPAASASSAEGLDWSCLVDAEGRTGSERFDAQFCRANFQPTERYVLTPPGNPCYRLRADESGYDNLILAGDWIKTGLDSGCVEAAVMSGMQASRAICGEPQLVSGEDDRWLAGVGSGDGQNPARYLDYGGLATIPPPLACSDVTLYGYVLRADVQLLQALCDRIFTAPSMGSVTVTPVSGHVLLMCGSIGRIVAQSGVFSQIGCLSEHQASLWLPVLLQQSTPPAPASLACFIPYMWVDNPISLIAGRELFGYAKTWGSIALPESGTSLITVEPFGGNFAKSAIAQPSRLLTVTSDSTYAADDPNTPTPWHNLGDVIGDLAGAVGSTLRDGLPPVAPLLAAVAASSELPLIYLKQFRATEGDLACLQQIVRASIQVTRIVGGPVPGHHAVTIQHLDSHPVDTELGLVSQQAAFAFKVEEASFLLSAGTVVWDAGATSGDRTAVLDPRIEVLIELAGTPVRWVRSVVRAALGL